MPTHLVLLNSLHVQCVMSWDWCLLMDALYHMLCPQLLRKLPVYTAQPVTLPQGAWWLRLTEDPMASYHGDCQLTVGRRLQADRMKAVCRCCLHGAKTQCWSASEAQPALPMPLLTSRSAPCSQTLRSTCLAIHCCLRQHI